MTIQNHCIDCGAQIDKRSTRCRSCSSSKNNRGRTGEKSHLWKGGLVKSSCEWCGKEFDVKPSHLKKGHGKFCSVKCRGRAHSIATRGENHPRWVGKVSIACEICGKEFEVYQSRLDVGHGRFCSLKCQNVWKSESLSGENSPNWRGRTLDRRCKNCGEEFKAPACVVEDGKGRFCSRDCYGAYYSGERRPQWEGGISNDPYPFEFSEEFKEKIRDRDKRKCVLCGKTEEENGRKMAVHHVTYEKDSSFDDESLYVSLCNVCHGKTNYRRSFWQTLFTEYASPSRIGR